MGKLYVIATPIGNMEDLTYRAARVFGELDALACEDTRMTRKIFERYQLSSPRTIFSYHEHNEDGAGRRILGLLAEGLSVGICSDGGCPGISDPGYRAIQAAIEAGHEIEVLPGASAVPTALLLSGLPSSSYTFKGFPPRKSGPRKRFLEAEKDLPHTMIIFESPFRVGALLADAAEVFGDREAAVCLELTKQFERVHRGTLRQLAPAFAQPPKGELTVVIAGNHPKFQHDVDETDELVDEFA
jgi:16S rRNA (cytidine1402-2'-O)-methyltransferase